MVVFTVGDRESYERGIDELGEAFKKMGKCMLEGAPFEGGSVWQTRVDAVEYLAKRKSLTHEVYELDANWDADTEQLPGEPFRRLLRDARITRSGPRISEDDPSSN